MPKRAKLASSAFRHYTSKARSAQVQCVLLVTVLLQILLCADDIEMNPGPCESETVTVSSHSETDMKAYMQDLFEHSSGGENTNSVTTQCALRCVGKPSHGKDRRVYDYRQSRN